MFCHNCGIELAEGVSFCSGCGAPVRENAEGVKKASRQPSSADAAQQSNALVGWSDRCGHPEILAAARQNKKSAIGCAWILALLFPIGFLIAGLFLKEMPLNEAIIIGIGLGVLMSVINLIRIRGMKKPVWEGVVKKKNKKDKSKYDKEDNVTYYTEYTVVIVDIGGKKHRIVNRDRREMYDYFDVGDRVRYHPAFSTYEKYDKSRDKIIYCNVCSMRNPIENDRCQRCSNLLFK